MVRKKNKTYIYLGIFLTILIVQFVCVFTIKVYNDRLMLEKVEEHFHEIDSIYARSSIMLEEDLTIRTVNFENDNQCYLALIDPKGDVINSIKGSEIGISASNIYKLLKSAKFIETDYDTMIANIANGKPGKVEFINSNQSKILIYTPVYNSGYSIVRIISKKNYIALRNQYTVQVNKVVYFSFAIWLVLVGVLYMFIKHIVSIEENNERHELIAADNDLISFTFRTDISCFEMSGAVKKVFGEALGSRKQMDLNTLSKVLHPDDASFVRNISKVISSGEAKYTTEFRMIKPSGDYGWYRFNGKSIKDDKGQVIKLVGTIQNSDDQIAHENMLKNMAEHDLLTGLLNKITLEDFVNNAIKNSTHNIFAFYIVDLDNFKAVNDNLGHAVGDKVLTDVASKLQLVFNETDYIGRLGGDEFAVLLVVPSMMVSQAGKLIKEKAALVNGLLCEEYGDDNIKIAVSASIGISVYPNDGTDFQSLYRHSDKALYHSKEHGKNQFTFYDELVENE